MIGILLAATAAVAAATAATAPPEGSLTLDRAEQIALAHQPQIAAARAQREAADARADQARAPLLPQVTLSGAYQRATANPVARAGTVTPTAPRTFDTYGFWTFGLTASQLIWDFGQTSQRLASARASAASQEEAEKTTRLQVRVGVRAAFIAAAAQRDLVAVARQALENQERHRAQIQAFVEVKTRPEIDLAQASADVANARVQLVDAENGYATAKASLNQAMGVEQGIGYEVVAADVPAVEGEDRAIDELVREALARRPELAGLARQAEAAELGEKAARAAYGPSLGVSTGVTESGAALDRLTPNWNAQALLSWPLFSGLGTVAQVREARAGVAVVRAQEQSLRQQVRLDLAKAQLGVRSAREALVASEEALVNAERRLELAEGRYAAGVGSAIELGDAQLQRTQAAAQRVGAAFSLASARVQLVGALGRL